MTKIAIIGSGYVGTTTAAVFASKGHSVICIDRDKPKVDAINNGECTIFEPGLKELISSSVSKGSLRASLNIAEAKDSEVFLICVGTPMKADGSADLDYIEGAAKDIGSALKDRSKYFVVATRSTVPPGTARNIVLPAVEKASGKKAGQDFGVCMVPEFLREGHAVQDFTNADRVVIGELDSKSGDMLNEVYSCIKGPKLRCGLPEAEMIKYMANSYLAKDISFANEMANLCKSEGIDYWTVKKGAQLDSRISPRSFLVAGLGFGGSCFPKDVRAIRALAKKNNLNTFVLDATLKADAEQPLKLIEQVAKDFELKNKKIGVLGLAFNPDTDDIRESKSLILIEELIKRKAKVLAYDPKAIENFRKESNLNAELASSGQELIDKSDIILIATAWKEFKDLSYKDKPVYEGRKLFDSANPPKNYKGGICW